MFKKLIIAGRGIRLAGAIEELRYYSLTRRVVTTLLGRDCLESNWSIGTIGIKGTANEILDSFDEIYFVGCSMPIAQLGYDLEIWKTRKIFSVNIEPPNGIIRCEWIKKDAKVWLREQLGLKD